MKHNESTHETINNACDMHGKRKPIYTVNAYKGILKPDMFVAASLQLILIFSFQERLDLRVNRQRQ
jgi:hypothetical protein